MIRFDSAPTTPLPPFPVSQLDGRHTGRLRKRDNLLTGEEGKGVGPERIIRPQEIQVLYKSFNTPCSGLIVISFVKIDDFAMHIVLRE